MLKSILKLIALAIGVYFLRDILSVIFPIPNEEMVEGFLDLNEKFDNQMFKLLRFIVWMVVLAVLIKLLPLFFGFVLPTAKRYSTTKPLRRFQGIFAEIFFIAILVFGVGLIVSVYPAYKDFNNERLALIESFWTGGIFGASPENEYKETASAFRHSLRYSLLQKDKLFYQAQLDSLEQYKDRMFGEMNDVAVEAVLDEKSVFDRFNYFFKDTIWITLIICAVLYFFAHKSGRDSIGRRFVKILSVFEQGRFGQGGSARFAGLFEEWATLFRRKGYALFLGRSLYNPFLYVGIEDSRHMMTVAGSRGGKGATAIIPNLLVWEGSALVIDPKGRNAAVTARRRKEMGQNVYIIDPFGLMKNKETDSFNPLSLLDKDAPNIREQISVIAEALVVPDQNQKEKHWDDGAKTVIAGMIGQLISDPKYKNPNLTMLRDMISVMPDEQAELWADMSLNSDAGRLAKDAALRLIRGINTNEISSIISNADKHTEWLSSPAMKTVLELSTFEFSELKDSPTTIYLILPPEYLQTHNRFLRLFVNLAISQMSVGGKANVPVLMLMDEFLALGRMEEVEKAFGLMAGYNLILWPFIQDLGRLKSIYGDSVNAFVANSRAVQVFGVADEETKEFISKYIGDRTDDGNAKIAAPRRSVPLRQPNEVAIDIASENGRQYILRSGKAPMVLQKVSYYDGAPISGFEDFPIFKRSLSGLFYKKYDKDPDYIKSSISQGKEAHG